MTTTDARQRFIEDVERSDGSGPEPWKPGELGEYIIGVIRGYEERSSADYGPFKIAILEDDDDVRWSVALFNASAKLEFERKRPTFGATIAVKYHGKVMGNNAREFKKFEQLLMQPPTAAYGPPDDVPTAWPDDDWSPD